MYCFSLKEVKKKKMYTRIPKYYEEKKSTEILKELDCIAQVKLTPYASSRC